jgi:hypothetical protein
MTQTASHKYFVGDLCYVLSDEWSDVCDLTLDPLNDADDREFQFDDGREFLFLSTAYGDGTYFDQFGNQYPVDSGTIGAVKVEYLHPEVLAEALERGLGAVHEFGYELHELDCEYDNGTLRFDRVAIVTGYEEEEEEEEEYEEEDEDA